MADCDILERPVGDWGLERSERTLGEAWELTQRARSHLAPETWHRSPANRESHALIPRGLKLDPRFTKVYTLNRIDGTTGPAMTEAVVDTALLVGQYAAGSANIHFFRLARDGTIRGANLAAREQLAADLPAALGVLRKMNPDERVERPRAALNRQLNQIRRLVEDLADTARVASGEVEFRRASVDLTRQLRELAEGWRAQALEQHKTFVADLPDAPVVVLGDVDRLQQVFTNLVGNAFKYTPTGGATTLSLAREDGMALIRVADEGEGIAPDRLPHVFELFQRATTTGSGLGVGLAVVRALVDAHGGTVVAASDGVGQGATFTVELPLIASQ